MLLRKLDMVAVLVYSCTITGRARFIELPIKATMNEVDMIAIRAACSIVRLLFFAIASLILIE